jgi:uncharacterized protein YybS (DUF2232 family)
MPVSLLPLLASALATALLITAAGFVGPLAAVLLLAAPVPIAYVGLTRGWLASLGAIILAAVLLALDNWQSAVQYLLVFGPGTLLVPELLKRKIFWDRAAAAATLGTLGLLVPTGVVIASGMGVSLNGLVRKAIMAEVAAAENLYPEMNIPPEQLIELQKVGEMLIEWVPRLYPAFVAISIGGVMLVLALALRRLVGTQMQLPGPLFSQWKLPEQMVWGAIVAGFASFAPWAPVKIAALNVLIVLLPLYFLQGMAIVASFLVKRNMPPFVRGMVYLLIVILNPLPLLVTALGVFDLWIDFRKPRNKKT